ncbi:MAG: SNF2-related protein [Terrimicrobiaceae bacterium]|nr:SNF2-related protein [Terrimicrobiaceae bacterium]
MKLEEIQPGLSLTGLEPGTIVSVIASVPIGTGATQVIYKLPDGTIHERLVGSADINTLAVATTERPWSFDGDGEAFKLAVEAKRIDLAFLFDPMMAVHTSNVQPLPHQITAVYESMLPRQPLRFVLADDPGAGKTIMAGLYIRELIMRADSRRILVVAPGSLVEQWRDELFEKFGLQFNVFSAALEAATPTGNPFEDLDHLIVRLDQMARNDELQEKLLATSWDLVIFDEAHKLSAHFGSKLEKTGRFIFAEKLGARTRHLLLLTATPHNGKDEDFHLFLSLLDSDRFYGKFRRGGDAEHKVDASDLMRRMVKEEMLRFDGTHLFPERRAYTANYKLSAIEFALYEAVTTYVETEMGKADALKGPRKGSVGFALTALQRRLASSPEAIFQSLKRRKERLEKRLREERLLSRGQQFIAQNLEAPPEDDDDLTAEEQEELEEKLTDTATAAQTIGELDAEILILANLVEQARGVVDSGLDRKWDELSKILQNDPQMRDADGRQRKMILFTEHKDTLNYLERKIGGVLGTPDAITTIHGSVHRDERRKRQEMFRSDPEVRILLATDAAGEGVNLQNANLMVNYDLPWNPNRLQFVHVTPEGKASFAGWAPHLDYEPLAAADRPLLTALLASDWIRADQEHRALALAATTLVPEHYSEVATRRIAHVDKTLAAVHERLTKEIAFWSDRWMRLKDDQAAGKDVRLNLDNIQRTINDLEGRLENRKKELQSMRHVTNCTPVVLGGALVVPIGLLWNLRGEPAPDVAAFSADPAARSRIEMLAMNAVRFAEEARGCRVVDVSAQKCGWDITSYAPAVDGKLPESRHIEVKGRIQGATTVTVTKNEIFESWNQGVKYHLAIVLVGEDDSIDGPHYISYPFKEEPGWGVSSVNYDIGALLARAKGNVA